MKKLIVILIVMLSITGCSNKSQSVENEEKSAEIALHDVPSGFTKDCEKAEFEKYNSYAKDNGLANTMIYVEGSYSEVNEMEITTGKAYIAIFTDTDSHEWLILLDADTFESNKDKYTELDGHDLVIIGNYTGYSDVYGMPAMYLKKMYDRNTGNIITSKLYENSGLDEIYANSKEENEAVESNDNNVGDSQEPTESEALDQNTIRPEIKESIDSYEEFINEYIQFLDKYQKEESSASLLMEYASFMTKYATWAEKMDQLDDQELTEAEDEYYTEVLLRTSTELAKYSLSMNQ